MLTHKPVTRRDFLAQGLIGGAALITAPTVGSLFSRLAYGDQAEPPLLPFYVMDLAGGAGLAANFLVGKQGGPEDILKSYDLLGWNPRTAGWDSRFGLPLAPPSISRVMFGMLSVMSPEAQAGFKMASICHQGRDDSSENQNSAIVGVAMAGLQGKHLKVGLGSVKSISGGNTRVPIEHMSRATLSPLQLNRVEDFADAIVGGKNLSSWGPQGRRALFSALLDYGRDQGRSLSDRDFGPELMQAYEQGHQSNLALAMTELAIDPRKDEIFKSVFGITEATSSNDLVARQATSLQGLLLGYSGPAVSVIGGCDYHDGTQQTGDAKDQEIGIALGRAIETAHRLKKPLFVEMITDGGVYARKDTRAWQGDAGDKTMTVMGFYHPEKAPQLRRAQVGWYTDGQGAERSTLVGASTSAVSYVVLANYLYVCGRTDLYNLIPRNVLPVDRIDEVLAFA